VSGVGTTEGVLITIGEQRRRGSVVLNSLYDVAGSCAYVIERPSNMPYHFDFDDRNLATVSYVKKPMAEAGMARTSLSENPLYNPRTT